jgi:hypothetical protein
MLSDTYISWAEVQRLALPANATILIPPTPEPDELVGLSGGAPGKQPSWLDDGFYGDSGAGVASEHQAPSVRADTGPTTPERDSDEEKVRMLMQMIAVNALLECGYAPQRNDDEENSSRKTRRHRTDKPD